MNPKLKKLIAREGLLFLLAVILAYLLAQTVAMRCFTLDIGFVLPRAGDADAVIGEETRVGFLLVLATYGIIRFTIWAIKTLRGK